MAKLGSNPTVSGVKRLPKETQTRARIIAFGAVVMLALAALLQTQIDPTQRELHKNEQSGAAAMAGLNNEFLLLPLLGFREAAAGLLWVRCDEFFHSGDYDAILPLVRVITFLDPKADNVYVTGAWHLSYNFTDSSERSDRRYIAPSEALLDEGIRNNMEIPDIKFEKGWQNYDKIKDYIAAISAFKLALATKPNPNSQDYPYGAPVKTWHILAHAYEKLGRIPEALAAWRAALDRSAIEMANQEKLPKGQPRDYGVKQMQSSEQHNYDETLQRWNDRYTTVHHNRKVNPTPYPAVKQPERGHPVPGPWDVAFHPQIDVTRPKVLKISGFFNAADGARVDIRVTDWVFKERPSNPSAVLQSFDVDQSQTILVDSISERKAHFEREMDMSKDPKMYSFSQDFYRIVLSYNPRITSPHLSDRFGWNGEGITDSNGGHVYIDKNPIFAGTRVFDDPAGAGPVWDGKSLPTFAVPKDLDPNRPDDIGPHWDPASPWATYGQPPRTIRVTFKVSRDQILGTKPITDANIVPNP